jgi:hypothetical protein
VNRQESPGRTGFNIVVAVIVAAALLYAGVLYIDHSVSTGLEQFASRLRDSLAAVRFSNIERFPERAFVVSDQDTVGTINAGGESGSGDNRQSLVLLGRWAETDPARLVRRRPTLSGFVQISQDSTSLVVQIRDRVSSGQAHVRGYLLLAPDSRWVTLY